MQQIERIDLRMPKGWSDMTVTELETVASVLVEAAAQRPALTPKQVKVKLFLALKVEDRSNLFKRTEAKDEAIGAMTRLVSFLKGNQAKLDAEAVKTSPFYEEPKPDAPKEPTAPPAEPWKNNQKGNKLFVTPAIE